MNSDEMPLLAANLDRPDHTCETRPKGGRRLFRNCDRAMNLDRETRGRLRTWVQQTRVAPIPLMVVLAILAAHRCCGADTNADGRAASEAAKAAARAGTLRFVEHRSPAGVSARILDGERPVFEGITGNAGLLLIQPAGRSVVSYPESKWQEGRLSLTGANTNGLAVSEVFRTVTSDLIERTVTVTAKTDQR